MLLTTITKGIAAKQISNLKLCGPLTSITSRNFQTSTKMASSKFTLAKKYNGLEKNVW